MKDQNLEQLARDAQSGDTEAFGKLYDATFDAVYKFFNFRVKNPADAQDLTSQLYLEAWKNLKRFNPDRSFMAWILGSARFRLIDHYRRQKRNAPLSAVMDQADTTDIEAETATSLENQAIREAILKLSEPYRTVIQLKYISELEYPEIAQIMGKTENNLRVIVNRGLTRLRKIIEQDEEK